MGWDLIAYIDVDQDKLKKLIQESFGTYDDDNYDLRKKIGRAYIETHLPDAQLDATLRYNESCGIYEMYHMYRTTFIRDDERFDNRRYQKMLEKKIGEEFPLVLSSMNFAIRTDEEAAEAAAGLRKFFADDERLMSFAGWLEETSKYCRTYELSSESLLELLK